MIEKINRIKKTRTESQIDAFMSTKYIKNNKLQIPLYHHTSSFFLDSIVKYGLGGFNPVKEYGILEFFKSAYEICNLIFKSDPVWIEERKLVVEPIANQLTEGFNFRHGGTYLSPSKDTAVRYAKDNPYGSEILSKSICLYDKICAFDKEHGTQHALGNDLKNVTIHRALNQNIYPILIEVFNLDIHELTDEYGDKSGGEVINEMETIAFEYIETAKSEPSFDLDCLKSKFRKNSKEVSAYKEASCSKNNELLLQVFFQQHNFELISPVKADRFKLYKISIKENSVYKIEYQLQEIKI